MREIYTKNDSTNEIQDNGEHFKILLYDHIISQLGIRKVLLCYLLFSIRSIEVEKANLSCNNLMTDELRNLIIYPAIFSR